VFHVASHALSGLEATAGLAVTRQGVGTWFIFQPVMITTVLLKLAHIECKFKVGLIGGNSGTQ
jgi:hypothetical protein